MISSQKMFIYFKGGDIKHTELLTHQLRGEARKGVKDKLRICMRLIYKTK